MLRGMIADGSRQMQLLDIQCIHGDTLNVHVPQAPKTLLLPGAEASVPVERRLRLGDLLIRVGENGWPELLDRDGQHYLPTYIGLAGHTYLPTLVKFLCAFGPTDTVLIYPGRLERVTDGVTVRERTTIGNVILRRKSWSIPVQDLRRILADPGSPECFERLHRFRHKLRMPDRIFALERVRHRVRGTYYKPQYLDLSSPLFIAILHSIALAAEDNLVLVERLPDHDALPTDECGCRWAVELIVDSLALQPPCPGVCAGSLHRGVIVHKRPVAAMVSGRAARLASPSPHLRNPS
jgi:hypothetical protein